MVKTYIAQSQRFDGKDSIHDKCTKMRTQHNGSCEKCHQQPSLFCRNDERFCNISLYQYQYHNSIATTNCLISKHRTMKLFNLFLAVASFNLVNSFTICDNYTTILFTDNNSTNQLTLITAVVNLAVLGDPALNVPGILASEGGLSPIFSGAGPTTNRGGSPVTINFLDGGSNQNVLLTHLYQFFGSLIGCKAAGFPAYGGVADMMQVHRFMDIDEKENDFFISQVGLAAGALGVSNTDVTAIANLLDSTFNTRCPPLLDADDGVPSFLVGTNPSICLADTCPLAQNSPCAAPRGFFARLFAFIRSFFASLFG
jgi:hypothetical protein